jgi:hypothetical protein
MCLFSSQHKGLHYAVPVLFRAAFFKEAGLTPLSKQHMYRHIWYLDIYRCFERISLLELLALGSGAAQALTACDDVFHMHACA